MGNTPPPHQRAIDLGSIARYGIKTYITIEPIMDFDLDRFVSLLKTGKPTQINIGADTCGNKLPEPEPGKVLQLIEKINEFTTIHYKSNLKRLNIKNNTMKNTKTAYEVSYDKKVGGVGTIIVKAPNKYAAIAHAKTLVFTGKNFRDPKEVDWARCSKPRDQGFQGSGYF